MNKILFTLTFFFNTFLFTQDVSFNIIAADKAVLFQIEGEKTSEIDSLISVSGDFKFNLSNMHNGIFRL